jgi:hypothetical protein
MVRLSCQDSGATMRSYIVVPFMLLTAICCLPANAEAQSSDPPLFAAFKTYCIQYGADPDAVDAAIQAAGGTQTSPPYKFEGWHATMRFWDLNLFFHTIRMITGSAWSPSGEASCSALITEQDDASLTAIIKWVGVAPKSKEPGRLVFDFEMVGENRVAAPVDTAAYQKDKVEGRLWELTLEKSRRSTSASLTHFLAGRASGVPN